MELRIKDILIEKSIQQKELAERMSVSSEALSRIIGNKGNPTQKILERIATALNVKFTELFEKPMTPIIASNTIICPNCKTEIKLTAEAIPTKITVQLIKQEVQSVPTMVQVEYKGADTRRTQIKCDDGTDPKMQKVHCRIS